MEFPEAKPCIGTGSLGPHNMSSIRATMSISQRYSRAAQLSAQKVAAVTAGISADGYWLDAKLFFFLAERIEPSIGRKVPIPSIANCETGSVQEVIPLELLARLLSSQSAQQSDPSLDLK